MRLLTDSSFGSEVLDFDGISIVVFSSPICIPCEMVKKRLEQLEANTDGLWKIQLFEVNLFDNILLTSQYQIQTTPTIVVIYQRKERARYTRVPGATRVLYDLLPEDLFND